MSVQAQSITQAKAKPYNPWLHSFLLGIRQNAAVTIITTFAFLILYTALPVIELFGNRSALPALPQMQYHFFAWDSNLLFALQLFLWLALGSALVQGLLSFRFLYGRKSSIAWFSLGLSRSDVFLSRFMAGAAGALLPVAVSMITTLGFNLAMTPDIGLVFARFAFFFVGMCVQILVLYSITAVVCVRVSTAVEGAAQSLALCLLPSVAIAGVNALMERLLFGTPYVISQYVYNGFNFTLLRMFSDWNPLLFLCPYMVRFGSGMVSADARDALLNSMIQPNSINWLVPLGWALAALALVWLARRLFLRRKAEIAGRIGTGRALGTLSVLAVGFAVFCYIYTLPYYLPRELAGWVPFVAAAALAFVLMLAVALPFRLLKRPRWKGFATVFGSLAVMAALVGILATGGLGYSSRVPEASDVKSVTISYYGLNDYVQQFELEQGGFVPSEVGFSPCVTLTDETDIQTVTDIHRKLIDTGRLNTSFYSAGSPTIYDVTTKIRYTLKNGSVVARTYRGLKAEQIKSMIALDDTAGVKKAYADSLLHPQQNPFLGDAEAYTSGLIILCSPHCSAISPLKLAAGERAEFIRCIADDLAAQPSADRYLPDGSPVCMIEFIPPSWSDDKIEDAIRLSVTKPVYVTPRFTRTLAFLNAHAISAPAEKKIEHIDIFEYANNCLPFDSGNYLFPIFSALYVVPENALNSERSDYVKLSVSDATRIQEILSLSRSVYLKSEGGYPLLIKLEGSDQYISAFLPAKDAPDFVKQGAK